MIGLNLCPFAAKPQRNGQIKIEISNATNDEDLLKSMYQELLILDETPVNELETTLVVVPNMLGDFDDYLLAADWFNAILVNEGWEGVYQIATFHPEYCFDGCEPEDKENLTNRAPYPIFHLIREASMEKVLARYPNPEAIPDNNIEKISTLSHNKLMALFPHIYTK